MTDMAPIMGRLLGRRGMAVTRQGDKQAGVLASIQTFTQKVTTTCMWHEATQSWHVTIVREQVQPLGTPHMELLWQGTLSA